MLSPTTNQIFEQSIEKGSNLLYNHEPDSQLAEQLAEQLATIEKGSNLLYNHEPDSQLAEYNVRLTRKYKAMDEAWAIEKKTKTRSPPPKFPYPSVDNSDFFEKARRRAQLNVDINSVASVVPHTGVDFLAWTATKDRRPPRANSTSTSTSSSWHRVPEAVVTLPRVRFATWADVEAAMTALLATRSANDEITYEYASHTYTWICSYNPPVVGGRVLSDLARAFSAFNFTVSGVSAPDDGFLLELHAARGDDAPLPRIIGALNYMATGGEINLDLPSKVGTSKHHGEMSGGIRSLGAEGTAPASATASLNDPVPTVATAVPAASSPRLLYHLLIPMLDLLAAQDTKYLLDGCRNASEVSLHPDAFSRQARRVLPVSLLPPAEVRREMVAMGFVEALAGVTHRLTRDDTGRDEERPRTVVYALRALELLAWDACDLGRRLAQLAGSAHCPEGHASSASSRETETHTTCASGGSAPAGIHVQATEAMAGLIRLAVRLATAEIDAKTGTDTSTEALPMFRNFRDTRHCRAISTHLLLRLILADASWVRRTLGDDALTSVMTYLHQPALAPALSFPDRPPIAELLASATAAIDRTHN